MHELKPKHDLFHFWMIDIINMDSARLSLEYNHISKKLFILKDSII